MALILYLDKLPYFYSLNHNQFKYEKVNDWSLRLIYCGDYKQQPNYLTIAADLLFIIWERPLP